MVSTESTALPEPRTTRTTYRGVARRAQILEVATQLFLTHGYADVSVDTIISQVGGSKTNVYSHFGNKEGLFAAVIAQLCERFQHNFLALELDGLTTQDGLTLIGKTLLSDLLQDEHIAFQRLITAESGRYPALTRVWFQAGPERSRAFIAAFLENKNRTNEVHLPNPSKHAALFHSMLVFDPVHSGMVGQKPHENDIHQHVKYCVAALFGNCSRPLNAE